MHSILKNETRNTVGVKGNDTYVPVPFFMSLRGYGLWVDTFSDAAFDLNVTDATRIRIAARGAKLRFVLFEGPRFPTILDRFTALAGRQQLPPYWAFAPWKARDYHRNQQEVYEDIDRYRKLGLPASVILIDSPWATNYNTYEFNPKQFANAPAMVRHLHDEGDLRLVPFVAHNVYTYCIPSGPNTERRPDAASAIGKAAEMECNKQRVTAGKTVLPTPNQQPAPNPFANPQSRLLPSGQTMRNEIRSAINRANAQKSTGPKTPEGKQRAAMNACRHGFTGQDVVLQPGETEAYNRLTNALLLDLKPATELERQTVQKLIDAHFRLNRLAGVENNIFNFSLIENTTDTPHDDRVEVMIAQTRAWIERAGSFDLLGRYEARLARQVLHFTLEFERLQTARRFRDSAGHRHENKRDRFDLASFGGNLPETVMSANSFRVLDRIPLAHAADGGPGMPE